MQCLQDTVCEGGGGGNTSNCFDRRPVTDRTVVALDVLLTVHRYMSVQQDLQDAIFGFRLLRLIASTCFELGHAAGDAVG
jgi:hypothetical protein